MCSALFLLSSCSSVLIPIPVLDVCGGHLLKCSGHRDIIRDFLRFSQLPGQRLLPSCHHLEGKHLSLLLLSRVGAGQRLGHRVSLIICSDLLLVRVYPCVRRESSLSSVSHLANIANPGVIRPGPQVAHKNTD